MADRASGSAAAVQTGNSQAAQAGWDVSSQQAAARSASGSLADATDKELEGEDDQDGDEDAEDDEEVEDCQSEKSAGSAGRHQRTAKAMMPAEVEAPPVASAMKTRQINLARLAHVLEEEERLTGYLIEAHALELEPQGWRETLSNEGPVENRMDFYKSLDTGLQDRKRKIDRLLHLIMEFGELYLNYTQVNEVMIRLRNMKRADEVIWRTLVERRENCMQARACAVHGSGYHSMHFILPEKFGSKSYIDVDRPLSRLQRCTDKNRHQIRTWMEKLFHTTATWKMSEQAYHEAIMNMLEGDVGAQAFRLKDLLLQDIIDTLIAKYDTTHRTPEELNEELPKIKREKHQSPYQFRQVIESMFKQMIAVQPIPESDAQLRVLLRERLLANVGEKTKGKLEKLMARCHQSGNLATVDKLYECAATSEAIKKDWVKGRASKVSVAKSYMPDVDEVFDEEDHHQEEIVKRANFRRIQE